MLLKIEPKSSVLKLCAPNMAEYTKKATQKSQILETLNLSTDADSSTNTKTDQNEQKRPKL